MKPQDRTRAILRSKLEPSTRLVLVAIADHMNEDDVAWPKIETIAEETGICERQVRDVLKAAAGAGIVTLVQGDHRARDITIAWERLADVAPPPSRRGGLRPAKTAAQPAASSAQPAVFAASDTGSLCLPDRQSLHTRPAVFASPTGKDCPRSDQEATKEAIRKRPSPPDPPQAGGSVSPTRRTRPPKGPKPPPTGYHEAIAAFGDAYESLTGQRYPWQFTGKDADGARVKAWLGAANVTVGAPEEGLARLRAAIRVYLAAEKAGKVFPFGRLPSTVRFTKELPEWLGRNGVVPLARGEYRTETPQPSGGDFTFTEEDLAYAARVAGS